MPNEPRTTIPLLSINEVTRQYNALSGESLNTRRVALILRRAEAKLRRELRSFAADIDAAGVPEGWGPPISGGFASETARPPLRVCAQLERKKPLQKPGDFR